MAVSIEMKDFPTPLPVVAVSAAIFNGDSILLAQRAKGAFAGAWSLPGGKVHSGERMIDAVRREVSEETGLDIAPAGIADIVEVITQTAPPDSAANDDHYVIVVFAATWTAGTPRAGGDAQDVRWMGLDDLERLEVTPNLAITIAKARHFLDGALREQ